ncbi:50S ribosomal protein L32e [Candidatus Woesearchaeota archaeon]|nr:50S ribosomal protein L32e [Candidatus Woesearchaeota archaeon]
MNDALAHRERIKSKKPIFVYQDAHKRVEIPKKWRKPKGIQSKMRLKKKGYRRCVSQGWRSPKEIRGTHPSGLIPVRVFNRSDLERIIPGKEGAVLAKGVGGRNRMEMLELAQKKNIRILNLKNPADFIKSYKEMFEQKKQQREESKKKKEAKKEAKGKKAEKKEEAANEEEQKKQEKKEKDKLLIQKK